MLTFHVSRTTTTRTTTQVITRYFGRWPQTKIFRELNEAAFIYKNITSA